ncbi:MAG: purine-nucleoside phosphorylase [Saprospiraceae bacterium]
MDKEQYYAQIQEASEYLREQINISPKVAIVLGTGLGNLSSQIENAQILPYSDIPHFPQITVLGHAGNLIFGQINEVDVMAMQGRFHYYEGYSMKEVTFPIRVMQALNIKTIIMSNAAGGVNGDYNAGDIVLVSDHISLHQDNPLQGENDERLGTRFPDMFSTYDKNLIQKAEDIAAANNITIHKGVYFGWPGPNLETPAEYNMINTLGGDLVGMSTVPEVLVAKHAGMKILVTSVVTNECFPIGRLSPTGHNEVIDVAKFAEPKLTKIITELIPNL